MYFRDHSSCWYQVEWKQPWWWSWAAVIHILWWCTVPQIYQVSVVSSLYDLLQLLLILIPQFVQRSFVLFQTLSMFRGTLANACIFGKFQPQPFPWTVLHSKFVHVRPPNHKTHSHKIQHCFNRGRRRLSCQCHQHVCNTRCCSNFLPDGSVLRTQIHNVSTWSNFLPFFAPANHHLLLRPLPPPTATARCHPFYGGSSIWWHLMAAAMDDGKVAAWQQRQTTTATRDTTINKERGPTITRRWCSMAAVGRGNNSGSGVQWQWQWMTTRW